MQPIRIRATVCMCLFVLGLNARAAESVRIVERGQPRAWIVIPGDASDQLKAAAELLRQYVREASGADLTYAHSDVAARVPAVSIYMGPSKHSAALDLGKMDDDGYVIKATPGRVVICGPTDWGTEFGVCEFLERYVGVRWLLPGKDGTDVPKHETIGVPLGTVRQEPAFFSRLFSGLRGGVQATWARRNRMHGRVSFHHNLVRLFPPETYTKTHPEFFPIIKSRKKGKGHQEDGRYLPPTNNTHGWQPCFTADGIVDEAIKNICAYFDAHPDAPSYSLGVNDSGGHCECQRCQAMDSGEKNSLGRRDVSDRYFEWCNKVVEGVLKKHSDKFFGCLAYSEVFEPPTRVKVHPRIIPYMTYDRMKWVDPEIRAQGEALTKRWQAMSPTLGWYDYIYGSPYCVPRVWFHHMADYYRFGHAHGVRTLYAEAYPNWGEGPKLYVSLKLQWDPNRDVDALLSEWYERCVGPGAAKDLAAYYAIWEDFWTRRVLKSRWFTKGGQYLRFNNPGYLADVTEEDIAKSRELLDRVVAKAGTPKQKARAALLRRAFEYYEASALAYLANETAQDFVVKTEADALRAIEYGQRAFAMAEKRLKLVLEDYPKDPVLVQPLDLNRFGLLRGDGWGAGLMWLAFDRASKAEGPVRQRLRELTSSPSPRVRSQAQVMLAIIEGKLEPLSKAPSFEHAQGKWPQGWNPWVKWGIGSMKQSAAAAHTGKQGILCKGMKRGGPHQSVTVAPGRYGAVAFVRVPQQPKGNATVTLAITPRNAQNANLPGGPATTVAVKKCGWTAIGAAGEIPAKIGAHEVTHVLFIIIVDGFQEDEEVHLDDAMLFRLP